MLDAETITRGIDDLPIICWRSSQLVKKKTGFIVSFMFAGLDPRNDWDMTLLSWHPSEIPQGRNFAQLYQMVDKEFLGAFQNYAGLIFPSNKRNPEFAVGNTGEVSESHTDPDDGEYIVSDEAFEMDDEEDTTKEAEQEDGFDDGSIGMKDAEGSSLIPLLDDDVSLGHASSMQSNFLSNTSVHTLLPEVGAGAISDALLQSSAYSLPSHTANYGFLAPTANSCTSVYDSTISSNAAPNSFMPVYAPNASITSIPHLFTSTVIFQFLIHGSFAQYELEQSNVAHVSKQHQVATSSTVSAERTNLDLLPTLGTFKAVFARRF
ncbi:hypothetical protein EV702DRAFT_1201353 [Suillus placidus]|uniref:Uncharacterized protein n=1 Tax=Suillus placidus TaxID=48579 RepID=A0A9P7CZ29_9AGAM|nr:hypothetical protein EV702DRAFT_1201353 [Suillus placidus]